MNINYDFKIVPYINVGLFSMNPKIEHTSVYSLAQNTRDKNRMGISERQSDNERSQMLPPAAGGRRREHPLSSPADMQ